MDIIREQAKIGKLSRNRNLKGSAAAADGNHVDVCVWLISNDESCSGAARFAGNNLCGVPHSALAWEDNLGTEFHAPGYLYWNETLSAGAAGWIAHGRPSLGVTRPDFGAAKWQGTRAECVVQQDIAHPSRDIASGVQALLTAQLNFTQPTVLDVAQQSLTRSVSALAGLAQADLRLLWGDFGKDPVFSAAGGRNAGGRNADVAVTGLYTARMPLFEAYASTLSYLASKDDISPSLLQLPAGTQVLGVTLE